MNTTYVVIENDNDSCRFYRHMEVEVEYATDVMDGQTDETREEVSH